MFGLKVGNSPSPRPPSVSLIGFVSWVIPPLDGPLPSAAPRVFTALTALKVLMVWVTASLMLAVWPGAAPVAAATIWGASFVTLPCLLKRKSRKLNVFQQARKLAQVPDGTLGSEWRQSRPVCTRPPP